MGNEFLTALGLACGTVFLIVLGMIFLIISNEYLAGESTLHQKITSVFRFLFLVVAIIFVARFWVTDFSSEMNVDFNDVTFTNTRFHLAPGVNVKADATTQGHFE